MKNVYIDLDGVLVDFVEGVCLHFGVDNPYDKDENLGNYDMVSLLGMNPNKFWDSLDSRFWEELPLEQDAKELYDICCTFVDYNDLYILTKPALDPRSRVGKYKWVSKHFPQLSHKIIFANNKSVCAHRKALLIDDCSDNITSFIDSGGNGYLYPQPWNSKFQILNEKLLHLTTILQEFS